MWAAADLYYLADRPPAVPFLWFRNLQAVPGALGRAERALAERRPALVIGLQPPGLLDGSGRAARLLRSGYELTARIDGVPVYRRRS
jgi:hypothetical protein